MNLRDCSWPLSCPSSAWKGSAALADFGSFPRIKVRLANLQFPGSSLSCRHHWYLLSSSLWELSQTPLMNQRLPGVALQWHLPAPSALTGISSRIMTSWMSALPKHSLTWFSSIKGVPSLLHTFPRVSGTWDSWWTVKNEPRSSFSISSLFHVLHYHAPQLAEPTFSLVSLLSPRQ